MNPIDLAINSRRPFYGLCVMDSIYWQRQRSSFNRQTGFRDNRPASFFAFHREAIRRELFEHFYCCPELFYENYRNADRWWKTRMEDALA